MTSKLVVRVGLITFTLAAIGCDPEIEYLPADEPADAGAPDAAESVAADSGQSQLEVRVEAEPQDEAAYLFDQEQVRTYDILIAEADLAAINAQPSAETWVPAQLRFEGQTYGPFKVRYKGADGAFRWPCTTNEKDDPKAGKCSIKLGFNEVDPEGRFFGLKKLNLHSMNADPSFMRDRASYALYRAAGLAAPRAVHARVLINGQLEGLFAAVEQIDGRFTRARFSDGGKGNLYKEVWPLYSDPDEYLFSLETNEDENPSVQRMLDFHQALAQSGDMDLSQFMDLDYLARFMAVDRVIVNDDGPFHFYCDLGDGSVWNHNYYWYESPQKLFLLPWDMDYAFDGSPWVRLTPAWSVDAPCKCTDSELVPQVPSSCDPLVHQLTNLKSDYEREIDAFIDGPFAADNVDAALTEWTDQIRPAVLEAAPLGDSPSEAEWADAVNELQATISATRKAHGLTF